MIVNRIFYTNLTTKSQIPQGFINIHIFITSLGHHTCIILYVINSPLKYTYVHTLIHFVIFQVRAHHRCGAPLIPGSPAPGCSALRRGQAGAQLPCLRHTPSLQDGADVHVRSLPVPIQHGGVQPVHTGRC